MQHGVVVGDQPGVRLSFYDRELIQNAFGPVAESFPDGSHMSVRVEKDGERTLVDVRVHVMGIDMAVFGQDARIGQAINLAGCSLQQKLERMHLRCRFTAATLRRITAPA